MGDRHLKFHELRDNLAGSWRQEMKLHAVMIGIDQYRDPLIRILSCARSDAEAMTRLVEKVHPDERTVLTLLNAEATKRNIMVAIGEALPRSVEDDDVVLLYFAGHGSPETDTGPDEAARYLVMHDTEYDSIYATGLDMERELIRWFERLSQARLVLLIVDACFSGRAGGRTFEGPSLRRERAGVRATEPIALQDLRLGEGRLMISACTDSQVAREQRTLRHGIFTHYLLRGPAIDGEKPSTVGLNALYDELARSVHEHTHGMQTPVLNGRSVLARMPYLW